MERIDAQRTHTQGEEEQRSLWLFGPPFDFRIEREREQLSICLAARKLIELRAGRTAVCFWPDLYSDSRVSTPAAKEATFDARRANYSAERCSSSLPSSASARAC
jgi:hypothetical protein